MTGSGSGSAARAATRPIFRRILRPSGFAGFSGTSSVAHSARVVAPVPGCDKAQGANARLPSVVAETGIRVLGPNTSGFVVPGLGLIASFVPAAAALPTGRVAVVAASGGVNHAVAFLLQEAGHGVSLAVGLGNGVLTTFPLLAAAYGVGPLGVGLLFAARGLQGAFAALMAPAALSIVTVMYCVSGTSAPLEARIAP